jgi:NADH:ubiquinone oxidoreductase subunit
LERKDLPKHVQFQNQSWTLSFPYQSSLWLHYLSESINMEKELRRQWETEPNPTGLETGQMLLL